MSGSSQVGDLRAAALGTLRTHGGGGSESQDVSVPGRGLTKWIETGIYTGESRHLPSRRLSFSVLPEA